jgi:LPXTG-motif cell wall-anchored protein
MTTLDLTTSSSTAMSSLSSTLKTLTTASIPTSPNSASSPSASTEAEFLNHTSNTGTKTGIGIVLGVAGLMVILGLLYWIRRRRSRSAQKSTSAHEGYTKPELDASNGNVMVRPMVQTTTDSIEMSSPTRPVELPQ